MLREAASGPVFIVSTGRCGSTFLSEALRQLEGTLSVSEMLASFGHRAFSTQMDPWTQMSAPYPLTSLLLRHELEYPELLYPIDGGGRFDRTTGIPPLLGTTLPFLDPDHDELYGEIADTLAPTIAAGTPSDGYMALMGWLARRFDREVIVERSGSSLLWVADLVASYPRARFVHLYRDGYACALSMQRHTAFRFALLGRRLRRRLGADPYVEDGAIDGSPPPDLVPLMPATFSRSAYDGEELPLAEFSTIWSAMTMMGLAALRALPPTRVLHMKYERLLLAPDEELPRLSQFVVGATDEGWVERTSSLVRSPQQIDRRDEAAVWSCLRGVRCLADAGLDIEGYATPDIALPSVDGDR